MSDEKLNSIAWTEGMFLRPQHLQLHDEALQDQLDHHLRAIDPFHWGVREWKLNQKALGEGRIEILELELVLKGGVIIRYPGNAVVETREFGLDSDALDLYVGVRDLRPRLANAGLRFYKTHPNASSAPLISTVWPRRSCSARYFRISKLQIPSKNGELIKLTSILQI